MSARVELKVRRLPHGRDMALPAYASAGSAGLDLLAAIEGDTELAPGERCHVPCGICLALPDGYEAQVRPRSGNATRFGISMPNAPGTIDADYRGEVRVPLINLGRATFTIEPHSRIAQMVIAPVARCVVDEVDELDDTERGAAGFGSTG